MSRTPKPKAAGGSGKAEGRDSWCTPKWLADLIGEVYIDVATNERSHIQSSRALIYEPGKYDGLCGSPGWYLYAGTNCHLTANDIVFCNPPYAHGEVIKWVKHWRESRFIFLLRWDPSTEWFEELIPYCGWVWFPKKRINFEPPPGVKASSNPFPHALYMSRPPEGLLDRLAEEGYLFEVDEGLLKPHGGGHGDDLVQPDRGRDAKDPRQEEGARDSGKGAGGVTGIAPWVPASPKPKLKWQVNYEPFKLSAEKFAELEKARDEFLKTQEEQLRLEEEFWQAEYERNFPGWTGWKDPGPKR